MCVKKPIKSFRCKNRRPLFLLNKISQEILSFFYFLSREWSGRIREHCALVFIIKKSPEVCILYKKLRKFIFETLLCWIICTPLFFLETEPDAKAEYKISWIEVFAPLFEPTKLPITVSPQYKITGNCLFFLCFIFFLEIEPDIKTEYSFAEGTDCTIACKTH